MDWSAPINDGDRWTVYREHGTDTSSGAAAIDSGGWSNSTVDIEQTSKGTSAQNTP